MSIVTKTGDKCKTSLFSGERVDKNDIRVDAYGTIDELNAFVSDAIHTLLTEKNKRIADQIQLDLYYLAADLATLNPQKVFTETSGVMKLEAYIDDFESEIVLTGFIVPGTTVPSAKLDICRTVARRAERQIVHLSKLEQIPSVILQYVNRLSDLFFLMARYEEKSQNKIRYRKESGEIE